MSQVVPVDRSPDLDRLRLECELYLGLLGLNDREDPGSFLDEALGLIVRVLGAEQGYLEVFDPDEGPTSWRVAGCSEEQTELIRTIVSRGIIAEAMAHGEVVACPSAILDPRFRDRPSVQASKIEAVLCVPIVRKTPIGVLYIQGRRAGGSFSESELDRARLCARHLAPLVESLFMRSRAQQPDHVAAIRRRLRIEDIIGKSAALAAVLRDVELVAPLDVSVLITGDMGTGKTQLARAIHENGPRRGRPFLEMNCAAIPDNLVESELFGTVPGAFTGAVRKEGRVAAAKDGTLFLDEVGELSLAAQAKLLTFLNTREYFPVGSTTCMTADARILAATNVDIEEAVRQKRFRSDLLFRLKVLQIRMPSLAERPEDIVPLAVHLCERAQRSHRLAKLELSPEALRAIEAAEWPGNIRDLANVVQGAAIRAAANGSRAIEADHVFREAGASAPPARPQLTFQEATRRFQADFVQKALEAADWQVAAAAQSLDLTKAHVYNLVKAFNLSRGPKSR